MERNFSFGSGTVVEIKDTVIEIIRQDGKSAAKSLFAGRAMGKMVIKTSSITGAIYNADYLVICASGLPTPSDFKLSNVADVKQYPNCIVAKPEELSVLYDAITAIIE